MPVRFRKALFFILAILIALALTRTFWLSALGSFLIRADSPAPADYAVVLAGDPNGNRILEAAQLVRRGLARKVLVDGPDCCYGNNESDLAIRFAVKKGYPADYFLRFPIDASSTRQEAALAVAELRRLGVRSYLLVTSDYHTRRAGRIFRRLNGGDLRMLVIAAPDIHFHFDSWWHDREAQKIVYMEWSKTVANWFGL
jgi:uncharacterized SAM-binding protein YcdF (DUF218 family)